MSNVEIRVISLDGGLSFSRANPLMCKSEISVVGINGNMVSAREYFGKMLSPRQTILSPAEVGTQLSHIRCQEEFLAGDADFCLIFEDDVIVDVDKLNALLASIKVNVGNVDFIHLGGLDGLKEQQIFDKLSQNNIPDYFLNVLWRACGYLISRDCAKKLVEQQKKHNCVADDWSTLLSGSGLKLQYYKCVTHPVDLTNSAIESERHVLHSLRASWSKRWLRAINLFVTFWWVKFL